MRFVHTLSAGLLAGKLVADLGIGDALYVRRNLTATAGLLLLARRRGMARDELGLGSAGLRSGLRWGGGSAAAVVATVTAGTALADRVPPVAVLLGDERADLATGALLRAVLVRIPLGTALFEEVAFRGVLRAACRQVASPAAATAWSSLLFGLWHVPPTAVALRINGVSPRSTTGVASIAGAVATTAVAGAALDLLRARSDSLAAPVLAHWALNAAGLVAAASRR